MRKIYSIGKYGQGLEIEDGKITKAICTCMWTSLYPKNYQEGETICKHLKEAIKLAALEGHLKNKKDDNKKEEK